MEVTTIGGGIVLAIIVIGIYCYYRFCVPKSEDKKAAEDFIKGYKGVFEKTVQRIIDETDLTKYHTVEEFESDIFAIAYDECWNYTEKALQEAMANSTIGSLIAKCITKESVEEYVRKLIEVSFMSKAEAKYVAKISAANDEALAADAAAQYEADLYETGEKEVEPYVEPEPEEPKVPLNHQTDEDGEYRDDDESQEIVGDVKTTTLNLDAEPTPEENEQFS